MLRVEMHDSIDSLIFRLRGQFTGEEAEYTRTLMGRCHTKMKLVVDLTEVVFVDSVGESVLSFLKRLGAKFIAKGSYALEVCERLRLPLTRNGISRLRTAGVPS